MKRKAILLVEGNRDDEILIARALAADGGAGELVIARDGVEAAEYLFPLQLPSAPPPSRPPCLIFLDPEISKIEWTELLRRVRAHERTRHLPVVVLASSLEARTAARGYGLGASSFIRKPVSYRRLARTVRQAAAYWRDLNEPAEDPLTC